MERRRHLRVAEIPAARAARVPARVARMKDLSAGCSRTASRRSWRWWRGLPRAAQSAMAMSSSPQARQELRPDRLPAPSLETISSRLRRDLYQEAVMQIAQVLAGYTLGGADLLRRRDGQEEPRGDGQAALRVRERRARARRRQGLAAHIFDLMRSSPATASQSQSPPPTRCFPIRLRTSRRTTPRNSWRRADGGPGSHRQGRHAHKGAPDIVSRSDHRHQHPRATSRPPPRRHDPLRFGRRARRGAGVRWRIDRRARAHGLRQPRGLCRRLVCRKSTAAWLEALLRSGSLDALGANRRRSCSACRRPCSSGSEHEGGPGRAERSVRARDRRARRRRCARVRRSCGSGVGGAPGGRARDPRLY